MFVDESGLMLVYCMLSSCFFLFSALYAVLLITFFLQAFLIPYFHFRSGDGVAGGTNINIINKYN